MSKRLLGREGHHEKGPDISYLHPAAGDTGLGAEALPETAAELDVHAAVLMDVDTGTVLYEKNALEELPPASVTKVMTMLLVAEAVDSGQIALTDIVTASARASSMGGSEIWLEEGEQFSVEEMFKCVAVVSANDCAVALAEYLCGSEAAFVERMNARAKELGLTHTNFNNCTGLFEDDGHYTCAYDLAVISRELLLHHSWVTEYTTIWMDTIRDGEFGLSNTNKLLRSYDGLTGLKTGYTSTAGTVWPPRRSGTGWPSWRWSWEEAPAPPASRTAGRSWIWPMQVSPPCPWRRRRPWPPSRCIWARRTASSPCRPRERP